jgi:hypothetical protein
VFYLAPDFSESVRLFSTEENPDFSIHFHFLFSEKVPELLFCVPFVKQDSYVRIFFFKQSSL